MYLVNRLSPDHVDSNSPPRLNFLDWLRIFMIVIQAKQNQKLSIIPALLAIKKYGLFLILLQRYPHIRIVPTQEIDAVLHAHMANINQFEKHCQKLFNLSLHHIPEFGLREEKERLEWQVIFIQTQELFERTFGKGSMGNSPPACCEILLA